MTKSDIRSGYLWEFLQEYRARCLPADIYESTWHLLRIIYHGNMTAHAGIIVNAFSKPGEDLFSTATVGLEILFYQTPLIY
jgi:hypothetical protein